VHEIFPSLTAVTSSQLRFVNWFWLTCVASPTVYVIIIFLIYAYPVTSCWRRRRSLSQPHRRGDDCQGSAAAARRSMAVFLGRECVHNNYRMVTVEVWRQRDKLASKECASEVTEYRFARFVNIMRRDTRRRRKGTKWGEREVNARGMWVEWKRGEHEMKNVMWTRVAWNKT